MFERSTERAAPAPEVDAQRLRAVSPPSDHVNGVRRSVGRSPTVGVGDWVSDAIVQAKLSVGPATDAYEREADQVAARVVRSFAASGGIEQSDDDQRVRRSALSWSPVAERRDSRSSTERVQRASVAPQSPVVSPAEIGRVRRTATVDSAGGDLDHDTSQLLESSRSGGSALPERARSAMEGAFGADFSSIRVHTGAVSSELNDRIQAKAFTTGRDVYFRDGLPDVSEPAGQSLLAHELTHTVQQGAARVRRSTLIGAMVRRASGGVRRALQRVFSATNPSTYDDDGGHALARHGPKRTPDDLQARLRDDPSVPASGGWASEEKMMEAVTKALATRKMRNAKLKNRKGEIMKRWVVNVNLAKCGTMWERDGDGFKKTEVDTAVVIFEIDQETGEPHHLVTAYPGDKAKEFNATAA